MKRILIIGNSGSGKTWPSKQISDNTGVDIVHFDEHFWEPGGFSVKREKSLVYEEIQQLSKKDSWIMEGVFGNLAKLAIPRATFLIFLNKNWDECRNAIVSRGTELSEHLNNEIAEKNHSELIEWASNYYRRETHTSYMEHKNIYDLFENEKIELRNRADMITFINQFALANKRTIS